MTRKEAREMLHKSGLKATPARIMLVDFFSRRKKPLSPHAVIEHMQHKADMVTVYRTLKQLKSVGILKQIDFQHTHAHYELAVDNDHHHIICTICGRIEDVDRCGLEMLEKSVAHKSKKFVTINHHALEFYGLCKSCHRLPR